MSRSTLTPPVSDAPGTEPLPRSPLAGTGFRSTLMRFWPALAILALFTISVLLRLPSFGIDPVADQGWTQYQRWNNTEVWLHQAFVMDVYNSRGPSDHKFAGYIGAGDDRFLPDPKHPELAIYASFPPTHFAVLYIALKAMGLGLTFTAMQIFSLALHALCVALVSYLAYRLTQNKAMAVAAAAMYTFSTGTLWYHMNVYWAHELFMPVFLVALVLFVRRGGRLPWWQASLLGAAMTLVTWTGVIAAAGFAMQGAWKYYRTKDRAYLGNLFMVAGVLAALALVVAQVLLVSGTTPSEYLNSVTARVGARSAGASGMDMPVLAWRFVNNLLLDYGGFILIALVAAARRQLAGFEWEVAFVAAFPLLESFLLLEHDSTYGFGRLKWLVPVILVACMAGSRLTPRGQLKLGLAVGLACLLHVGLYFVVFDTGV